MFVSFILVVKFMSDL